MSTAQQIFLLFYAILYGALFTLSDRWKPFAFGKERGGIGRYALSVTFFGILPIVYLYFAFYIIGIKLGPISGDVRGFLRFLLIGILVTPVYGFYTLWIGIVLRNMGWFYSPTMLKFLEERAPSEIMDKAMSMPSFVIGFIFTIVPLLFLSLLWLPC